MRTYIQDAYEIIESEDGRARFTLHTVPVDDVAPEVTKGYARRRAEFMSVVEKRDKRAPQWRAAKLSGPAVRLPKSPDAPGFVADPFTIGDWVEWYQGETRVVGQVWSHAPAAGSFWITTDRSGVTGRVHVMNRRKVAGTGTGKNAQYVYSVGGATVRSMGAAGADVCMTGLSDSLGHLPESPESYADHVPPKGYQPYDPVTVHVGKTEVRGDRVWFPMVVDGIRVDADSKGSNEWLVSVQGINRPLAVAPMAVARGMVTTIAIRMLRELREVAEGVRYGGRSSGVGFAGTRKFVIRETESFGVTCHECDENGYSGDDRLFLYEEKRAVRMCAPHLAKAMTYKSSHGDGKTFTAREIEQIGDAQCVMGMRNSLAAHAMVALIAGEVDAPAVAELEQAERTANSSAETCAGAAECAADRADRAAESAESAGATDADGAWAAAEEAERAARDAQVCAQQIPADRVAYADRARSAVSRAQDAAERARRTAEDRQCAADDERCGIAAAEEAESAANAARESATAAGRWADGCPPVGDAPAVLNVWVQEARAAAAEAAQWAERARSAAASREAELRPWGRIEWHTIAGAAADDARDAAKRAAESARLAAGARGRADRAAAAEEPALDSPAPSQERDADAPNGVGAEGGKEGISPELDADASIKPGGAAPAADGDEGEGGGGALVAGPHPGRGPVSGPAAGAPAEPAAHRTAEGPVAAAPEVPALPRGFDADAPTGPAPEITRARRRAEEAELRAVEARRRAEQLHTSADAHYGRFAGGQPILMGHHSARGALRARERGDAATRRAVEATAAAERAERDARKATAEAERAAIVHGRSRPWERSDFRPGDVVEARKVYTDRYVVVRANPKTVTLRNVNTITDTKARYDQILSRTRDGQTVTNPGADDSPAPADVPAAPPAGPATDAPAEPAADVPEWAPAPGAERWDFAAVRRVLVREGLVEGELGERDGWQIGPDMWDVRIMRVQGSDCFRPRGAAARGSWDEALDAYRAAVEAAGMTVVRRNAHCVVVRVADELRVTARARRTAELEDFTTTVTFDGYEGIGGTVTLHSAGAGASWFEVRDHTGRTIPDPGRDRRTATASLAHAYGLPTPAEYIEEGPAPAAPARAEGPPAPAVPAESGPAPQRAEGELRDLVHDADRPAVPEPSAAAVPPPAEPGPEADGGPAPAAGPRPGPPPGGAPAAAGAPRRAAGAPRGRVPVARGSAAGVRGYPHRSQQPTGGHATTPTTTPTTTPGAGTGGRAAGGRGPPRLPGPGPGPGGCAPVELDRNASRATGGAPPGRTPPPSAHALSVPYAKVPT